MDIQKQSDRDVLGNIVRVAWQRWAREQPDIEKRPDWLTPYDELEERFKEVDRQIGCMVYLFAQGMLEDEECGDADVEEPGIARGDGTGRMFVYGDNAPDLSGITRSHIRELYGRREASLKALIGDDEAELSKYQIWECVSDVEDRDEWARKCIEMQPGYSFIGWLSDTNDTRPIMLVRDGA